MLRRNTQNKSLQNREKMCVSELQLKRENHRFFCAKPNIVSRAIISNYLRKLHKSAVISDVELFVGSQAKTSFDRLKMLP